MLREQFINFLQAVVVFLLLTNVISVAVTAYAMRLANAQRGERPMGVVARKVEALVGRGA
jgi:hypothetical protein